MVVFVTTYLLILPAITVETATDEYYSVINSVSGNSVSGNSVSGNSVSMGNLPVGIESPEDWEQITGNVDLTGDWATDVVAIAKSQLGYEENLNYYNVESDGTVRGYTRYGEWYGEPYREWSALFASFCLHYAQVSETEVPQAADSSEWITALAGEDCGRYRTAAEYTPFSGDLMFLDMDEDETADSVAIIDVVVLDENGTASEAQVIQGDCGDRVQYITYSLQDVRIVGYGQISENGAFFEKSYTDGKVIITARYTQDAQIPAAAQLQAYRVTQESAPERYEQRQQDMQEIIQGMQGADNAASLAEEAQQEYLIYNIGFYLDEQEIQPADKVNVTIQFLSEEGFAVGDPIVIVHFAETGTETMTGMTMEQGENGELTTSFETTGFSDYGISLLALDPEDVRTVTSAAELYNLIMNPISGEGENAQYFNGVIKIGDDGDGNGEFYYDTWNVGLPTLESGRNVTIDLNGQKIGTEGSLVQIQEGATLVIKDSAAEANPGVTREVIATDDDPATATPSILDYDKTASYDPTSYTLTYYVTETAVIDAATGATKETLVKYTVTGQGVITTYGPEAAALDVRGGTLTIESGMIANCSGRAIYALDGTVNLYGGYLCGNNIFPGSDALPGSNDTKNDGGAVFAADGSFVDLKGTVVAGNRARYGGGIHITVSTTLEIGDSAVVAGNIATFRGGGVDAWESTIIMEGGYVTNNVAEDNSDYYSGGGGIRLRGDGGVRPRMTLSGGYVTGNKAYGGGGIYAGDGSNTDFIMTGGFVTANYASTGEGGGVRIDHSCIGRITGGYITNNITASQEHWGGGGLFIADAATCQVLSVLVTNNDAGGFGGGVAGCSTGRIYMSAIQNDTKGAAIYANSASGTNISGSASIKQQDHVFALSNKVFMESGYEDYFCMLYSNVTDAMLGDGSQNWSGSIDGVSVTIPEGESRVGNSVVGLTANPSADDIAAAQNAAARQQGVYINGNSAYTHGGGILCNGYMVLGALEEGTQLDLPFGTRIELAGVKDFVNSTGDSIEMQGGEFNFILTEAETEKEVARATNDSTGTLIFDRRLVFDQDLGLELNQTQTYRYILAEADAGVGIMTDETKYLIEVTVQYISENDYIEILLADGTIDQYAIEKFIYHLEGVNIYKLDSAGNQTSVLSVSEAEMASIEESQAIVIDLRNEDTYTTFVNYAMDDTDITVTKTWAEGVTDDEKKPITVVLEQNGEPYTSRTDYEVTLDGDVDTLETAPWTYTWTGLPIAVKDGDDTTYSTYAVREMTLEGFLAEYEYTSTADSAAYWVPATELKAGNQYMIVNNAGDKAFNVTSAHSYSGFSQTDSMDIAQVTDANILQQLGREGQVVYDASSIPDTATFIAQAYKEKVVLKNSGYHNSWLQIYSIYDWGGTPGRIVSDASFFEYNNGLLQGRVGSAVDGELRDITYDQLTWVDDNGVVHDDGETMFTVSRDATDTNPVKLYTLVRTVSGGASTVNITNTPIERAKFTIELTKYGGTVDENGELQIITEDGVKQVLVGAEFEIFKVDDDTGLEAGPLRFIQKPNGDYEYDATNGEDSDETLVTDEYGEIKVVEMQQGEYVLKETKAPRGYERIADQTFTLNEEDQNGLQTLEVIDKLLEYELPDTGGGGTYKYTVAGLLLILSTVYLLYKKRTRKDEEYESI